MVIYNECKRYKTQEGPDSDYKCNYDSGRFVKKSSPIGRALTAYEQKYFESMIEPTYMGQRGAVRRRSVPVKDMAADALDAFQKRRKGLFNKASMSVQQAIYDAFVKMYTVYFKENPQDTEALTPRRFAEAMANLCRKINCSSLEELYDALLEDPSDQGLYETIVQGLHNFGKTNPPARKSPARSRSRSQAARSNGGADTNTALSARRLFAGYQSDVYKHSSSKTKRDLLHVFKKLITLIRTKKIKVDENLLPLDDLLAMTLETIYEQENYGKLEDAADFVKDASDRTLVQYIKETFKRN